jgi:glycosyltransferase involved in cell wall biosynthesis
MKPIRVLAILEASTVTGPAKNLLEFARLAREDGFDTPVEVSIATFTRAVDFSVFSEAAAAVGIAVHPISERGRFDRSVLARLRSLARDLAPDILQTHAVKSHFLLRCSGLHRTMPWVAFHHGYTWPDLRARAYNQLDRWSLRAARRVVTVSLPFRAELSARGVPMERIAVLHNAIDPDWATPARDSAAALRAELGIAPDRKTILIVGRLSREKDHLTLLEAVASILKEGAILPHLLMIGEGPERPRIEERIRELDLTAHVTMTGQVRSAKPYYGIADTAVLSSRSEGSPNALLEAMAARVPVVATAVGGIPEMVTDRESALLVAPGDREGLTRALSTVLTDRDLAESLRSRAHLLIEERYSPERRARALCEIYRGLLAQP